VPEALAELIHQLLAKKKEHRPPSARAVAEMLEVIAEDPVVAATLHKPGSSRLAARPAWTRFGRRKASWLSVAALVGLIVAAVLLARPLFHQPAGDQAAGTGSGREAPRSPRPTFRGVTDDEIVLGMSAPFSGPSKELGEEVLLGMNTYFQHVNEQGGVHGRKLKVIALDDEYKADKALERMKELYEDKKVFAVIGNVGTPTAVKTLPYAREKQILFFAPFTGANLLRTVPPDELVFNYRASYAEETAKTVNYLLKVRKGQKVRPEEIAVFAQQDSYGDNGFGGVARALRDHGRNEDDILRVGYDPQVRNIRAAVAPAAQEIIKRKDIKAVIMVATYNPAAEFIQAVRSERKDIVFTNVSFVGSNALLSKLLDYGPEYAEGVIVTQVVPHPESGASAVREYRQRLEKYFPNKHPSFNSLEGYLSAAILVEGLKLAGDDLNTETLVRALESIKDFQLGIGVPITFNRDEHQASHKVWGTVIENGKFTDLELD